jgi:hypothetical protein
LRISESIGATTYSYLKCVVYDKLLKPPTIILNNPVKITLYKYARPMHYCLLIHWINETRCFIIPSKSL